MQDSGVWYQRWAPSSQGVHQPPSNPPAPGVAQKDRVRQFLLCVQQLQSELRFPPGGDAGRAVCTCQRACPWLSRVLGTLAAGVLPVVDCELANAPVLLFLQFGLGSTLCHPEWERTSCRMPTPGFGWTRCLAARSSAGGTLGVQRSHLCCKHFLCLCSCAYVSRRCLREHSAELK